MYPDKANYIQFFVNSQAIKKEGTKTLPSVILLYQTSVRTNLFE